MRDRLLTSAEKRAFRTMQCGGCGKWPPYEDGSWTQKHRLKPGSKGGRYTKRNTVPRCPRCHAKAPGHAPGFIMLPQVKRLGNGLKYGAPAARQGNAALRAKYSPEAMRSWRVGHRWTPEQRAKLKGRVPWMKGKHHSAASRAKLSAAAQKRTGWKHSPATREKISAAQRGRPKESNHRRYHVRRNIVNPRCPFCRSQ